MSTTCELSFQQKGLFQQGCQHYSAGELKQLEWGLRFTAAVLFLTGLPVIAIAVGVALLALQTIVITTHFCTLSWMYEARWNSPKKVWIAPSTFHWRTWTAIRSSSREKQHWYSATVVRAVK